jgi:hypothetical protein
VARNKQAALDEINGKHPEQFVAGAPAVTMPQTVAAGY